MAPAPDAELALADTPSAGAPAATAPVIERTPVVDPKAVQKAAALREKQAAKRRSAVAMYETATAANDAADDATARERQQRDYEAAKSKYDASEREEGYRWAKSNRVRIARYCRTTARRTDAFMEAARKRVLVGLLVGEVARRNELRLEPERLNETMRLIASTYEQPQQVIDLYRNDPQLMQGLQNRVMEEQVTDWIAERAKHTEKALSFQDAIGQ